MAILVESIAEIINRSQAFTVYKAVSSYLDKDAEKKRRDDAKIAELVEKEGSIFEDLAETASNRI